MSELRRAHGASGRLDGAKEVMSMGSNVSNEGSVGVGFALGFFLGLIGLAVSFFVLNAPATKKGSIYGLAAQFVMGFVLAFVVPAVMRP